MLILRQAVLTTFVAMMVLGGGPLASAQDSELKTGPKPLPLTDASGNPLGLFRRVVSKPDVAVMSEPEGGQVVDRPRTFSTHYVFEEREVGGATQFLVGPPGRPPSGWLAASDALEWPNNVSLVFNVPLQRYPVMFFDGLTSAVNYRDADPIGQRAQELTDRVKSGAIDDALRFDTGLTAVESETYVDWTTDFYLMPVLGFQERADRSGRGDDDMYLNTAAIPLRTDAQTKACSPDPNVAIVFVIDTTSSMQDYIDRTRDAVQTMTDAIVQTASNVRVSFGLVGYRDDPSFQPGIEYRARSYSRLDPLADPMAFPDVVAGMKVAKAATQDFSEDAIAGLREALDQDWNAYSAKWIVLITDASPRPSHVDAAGAEHSIQSIADELWDLRKTGLVAIHLQTPEASAEGDLREAEDRLRALSTWSNVAEDAYFPIPKGDLRAFGNEIDRAALKIIDQINLSPSQLKSRAASGNAIDRIGYAQRVIWLGECADNAPPVLEGWTIESAVHTVNAPANVVDNEPQALQPRILLTRQHLDNLVRVLEGVMASAQADVQSSGTFFTNLVSNLAIASLDATQLSARVSQYQDIQDFLENEVKELRDLLPSYLTLVPFSTDLMTMTERRWARMRRSQRDALIATLRTRIEGLKTLYNSDGWVKLHPESTRSEEVMPVLVTALP